MKVMEDIQSMQSVAISLFR